jgi:DNA-directed RNA polymerase subunit RPC12/RpoP
MYDFFGTWQSWHSSQAQLLSSRLLHQWLEAVEQHSLQCSSALVKAVQIILEYPQCDYCGSRVWVNDKGVLMGAASRQPVSMLS